MVGLTDDESTTRYLLFMLLTTQFLCTIRNKLCHPEGNYTFQSNLILI